MCCLPLGGWRLLSARRPQVRAQRKQQRIRRAESTIPVVGLCGYTNSGCVM